MKQCKKCKEWKDESEFGPDKKSKDKKKYYCKSCLNVYRKEHQEQNRVSQRKYNEKAYKSVGRNAHLKRTYGITLEEYNQMFEEQNGCCAICGKHQSEFERSLCVDHDHITGKIRSLLCDDCNKLLGYAYDDTEILSKSINYLISFSGG